jgi:hypothetical protein
MQLLFYNIDLEHILREEGAKYILMPRFGLYDQMFDAYEMFDFSL